MNASFDEDEIRAVDRLAKVIGSTIGYCFVQGVWLNDLIRP
jgi:hypothetical protein